MALTSERLQLPAELKEAIRSKKCVAFVGSGLSAGCYDSWPDLVNALCERCGSASRVHRDSHPDEFLDAAQDAKDANENEYYNLLWEHFGRPAVYASLLYDSLFALPFGCYLTLNFDPLLALKCRTAKIDCDTTPKAYPSLDRMVMARRSIHYLHGLIQEGSAPARGTIVLAREDFETAYSANSNLMNLLVPTLVQDPIVFVGCRLKEPPIKQVFSICKKHQQTRLSAMMELGQCPSKPPRRFILLPKPEVRTSQIDVDASQAEGTVSIEAYYGELGITPVWYASDGDHIALRRAFDDLAELPLIGPDHGWDGGDYGN